MEYVKQIRWLLFSLLVLVVASIWYAATTRWERRGPEPLFNFTQMPDSIWLSHHKGMIRLVHTPAGWRVNGLPANNNRVAVLLAALQQSVSRRPVARKQADSLSRMLALEGAEVQVFAEKKPVVFRVGGHEGSMKTFVEKNNQQVVEVTIPGYRVFVAGIFLLPETEWIDPRIFNFNWRNFRSLSARFFDNPADSFTVTFNGRYFALQETATDTARLNTYLDEISLLEADRFYPFRTLPDSLANSALMGEISVSLVSGSTLSLRLFRVDNRLLGVSNHLPVAVFAGKKVTLLNRRRNWFVQQGP